MATKWANHKYGNFKICSNGLTMVDYPIYNPNDDNRRYILGQNETFKPDYYILLVCANIPSYIFNRL